MLLILENIQNNIEDKLLQICFEKSHVRMCQIMK